MSQGVTCPSCTAETYWVSECDTCEKVVCEECSIKCCEKRSLRTGRTEDKLFCEDCISPCIHCGVYSEYCKECLVKCCRCDEGLCENHYGCTWTEGGDEYIRIEDCAECRKPVCTECSVPCRCKEDPRVFCWQTCTTREDPACDECEEAEEEENGFEEDEEVYPIADEDGRIIGRSSTSPSDPLHMSSSPQGLKPTGTGLASDADLVLATGATESSIPGWSSSFIRDPSSRSGGAMVVSIGAKEGRRDGNSSGTLMDTTAAEGRGSINNDVGSEEKFLELRTQLATTDPEHQAETQRLKQEKTFETNLNSVAPDPGGDDSMAAPPSETLLQENNVATMQSRNDETDRKKHDEEVTNDRSVLIGGAGAAPETDEAETQRLKMISQGNTKKIKLLGRGSFGAVYSVLLGSGEQIAVKEMPLPPGAGSQKTTKMLENVNREMDIMRKVAHPNVVHYYQATIDHQEQLIKVYMELVTGGSLGDMCRASVPESAAVAGGSGGELVPLAEDIVKNFIRQALQGLAHIHEKGVAHRDLKGDNILLTASGQVKLADFGAAKSLGGAVGASVAAQTVVGTPYFIAPEVLDEEEEDDDDEDEEAEREKVKSGYGTKADIWSMGITVAELLNCGKPPWPKFKNVHKAFAHISTEGSLPVVPPHCSEGAKDFILAACQRDPKQRPSAATLLEHPWLAHQPQ